LTLNIADIVEPSEVPTFIVLIMLMLEDFGRLHWHDLHSEFHAARTVSVYALMFVTELGDTYTYGGARGSVVV
jgi:hypothetical protein